MDGIAKSVRDNLVDGLNEYYKACKNTAKNPKCLSLDKTDDLPCHCEYVENIRQQIRWLEEDMRKASTN